jgi:DNA replication protein DnaC
MTPLNPEELRRHAQQLGLFGLLREWERYQSKPWIAELFEIETKERTRRGLERRLRQAKLGSFKPMADFDWGWPKKIDREHVEDCLALRFLEEKANVVLVGPNGIGKTMIAQNIAYAAVLRGISVLRVNASEMLSDLSRQDTSSALQRRLRHYTQPGLLLVDEVGYLAYDLRAGDLLFEVVSRRHQARPIVLTTNRLFAEWNEVFPNSSCVTALVDRLLHKAEIVNLAGLSYRTKEAEERNQRLATEREKRKGTRTKKAGGPK